MMRYSNNDNITNDLTRIAYKNNDYNDYKKYDNLTSNDLLPLNNSKDFLNTSNPFKNILPNKQQFNRSVEKIDTNSFMKNKGIFDQKEKTIQSLNEEVNKLKNSLNEVIIKDKEIQELKNKNVLLNKELQERSGDLQKIKDLEMEIKFIKKKLDDEYLISSEVKTVKKDIDNIKKENTALRKNILKLNQEKNLFKLKKIIHKHTKCDLEKLNIILKENDITEDSFILNDINDTLIKKVIKLLNTN